MTRGWRILAALAALAAVLAAAAGIALWSERVPPVDTGRSAQIAAGLGPALVEADVMALPDAALLDRLTQDCWRRVLVGDPERQDARRCLPEAARWLWTIAVLEQPLRRQGFAACLQQESVATGAPTLADLAESYDGIGQRELAAIVRTGRDGKAGADARLAAALPPEGTAKARIVFARSRAHDIIAEVQDAGGGR